jgi:uncharacterized alkaline shock family protein YloU
MLSRDRKTDFGVVKINDDVVAGIASVAAMGVDGVADMGGSCISGIIYKLRRSSGKGIKVLSISENDLRITISVIVRFGVNIPDVAFSIQENVKDAIERMLGIVVSEVDVQIQGVVPNPKGGLL